MLRIGFITTLCALLVAAGGRAQPEAADAGLPTPRLAVAFLTDGFLAEVVARAEAARIENERITDTHLQESAGLIWTRNDNGVDIDWYDAGSYCEELDFAGWRDWFLPSIDQLEALHDRRSAAEYKLPAGFKLTACCPWSSTRNGETSAWNFSFRHRQRFSGSLNYSFQLRAICARPASASEVAFYEWVAEEARRAAKLTRRGS